MNKREWLRSQGFQVGERGRLSPVMIKALEDYTEVDDNAIEVECIIHMPNYLSNDKVQVRSDRIYYGKTKEGKTVTWVTCFSCHEHVSYCQCESGIKPPPNAFYEIGYHE